jgi:hypothetical protein
VTEEGILTIGKTRLLLLLLLATLLSAAGDPGLNFFINTDGSIGLTFNRSARVIEVVRSDTGPNFELEYSADGVVGSKAESLPNHIAFDVHGAGWFVDWPGRRWVFELELPQLGIEASQSFDRADFAGCASAALAHPYLLEFLYRRVVPPLKRTGAHPCRLALGYALLRKIEGDSGTDTGWRSRLNVDLFLDLPIANELVFAYRLRGFSALGDIFLPARWKGLNEVVGKVKYRETWFFARYMYGELPPEYNRVNDISFGIGFAF